MEAADPADDEERLGAGAGESDPDGEWTPGDSEVVAEDVPNVVLAVGAEAWDGLFDEDPDEAVVDGGRMLGPGTAELDTPGSGVSVGGSRVGGAPVTEAARGRVPILAEAAADPPPTWGHAQPSPAQSAGSVRKLVVMKTFR